VLNGDDPNVLWMKSQTRAGVITFGMNDANDVRATDVQLDWPEGTRFKLHMGGRAYDMKVRLIGRHMVYPILAAAAVAHAEGYPAHQFLKSLEELTPTPGRLQPVRLQNGAIILRDEFKSSLETIETAMEVLSEIPAHRKLVVLGEVSEPPGSPGPIYRKIGEQIAKTADHVILIGKKRGFQNYRSGASRIAGVSRALFTYAQEDVLNAVGILQGILAPGDVVLVKGRGNQRLERISLALTDRTVKCYISRCDAWIGCDMCPMLEMGWNGLDVVV
jgi:UDP-N-acetylmuramoyl-tripeptide--D-alanyl-D-alanine ligase